LFLAYGIKLVIWGGPMYETLTWFLKRLFCAFIRPLEFTKSLFREQSFVYDQPLKNLDIELIVGSCKLPYVTKFILKVEALKLILDEIKSSKYATSLKKFNIKNPYINYITLYEIHSLDEHDKGKSIYANHFHTDDTVDPSCVKFFQLPFDITISNGPMQFISKENTALNHQKGFFRGPKLALQNNIHSYKNSTNALFLDPRSCLHKAGVPINGFSRIMLMVQIIESKKIESLDDLYLKQFKKEPTLLKH